MIDIISLSSSQASQRLDYSTTSLAQQQRPDEHVTRILMTELHCEIFTYSRYRGRQNKNYASAGELASLPASLAASTKRTDGRTAGRQAGSRRGNCARSIFGRALARDSHSSLFAEPILTRSARTGLAGAAACAERWPRRAAPDVGLSARLAGRLVGPPRGRKIHQVFPVRRRRGERARSLASSLECKSLPCRAASSPRAAPPLRPLASPLAS